MKFNQLNYLFILITLIFLFLINKGYSRCNDSLNLHNLIAKNFNNIPNSYFVFLITSNISANSNANMVFLNYRSIINNFPCNKIYYIIDGRGLSHKNVNIFFTNVLKIPYDQNVKYNSIIDTKLYRNIQHNNILPLVFYIYQENIVYSSPFKLTSVGDIELPCDVAELSREDKIKVESENYINTNINSFYAVNNNILQLADISARVDIIDTKTGKYRYILDKSLIDPIKLYKEYVTKSKKDIQFAEKNAYLFKESNREVISLYSAFYDGVYIFINFGIHVMEMLKKDIKLDAGTGKPRIYKKGTPIGELYGFFIKCDTLLQIKDIYFVSENFDKKASKIFYADLDVFHVKNDLIYGFNSGEIDLSEKLKRSNYYNKGISIFSLEKNNKLKFKGVAKAPLVDDFEQKSYTLILGDIFEWNNNLYVHYSTSPKFYDVNSGKEVGKLKGLGITEKKEHLIENLLDTIKSETNWAYFSSGKIFSDKYYAVVYMNKDQHFLEIKDQKFKTIQIINLKEYGEKFPNCVLVGDYLYNYLHGDDGEFYFYKYKINQNKNM